MVIKIVFVCDTSYKIIMAVISCCMYLLLDVYVSSIKKIYSKGLYHRRVIAVCLPSDPESFE